MRKYYADVPGACDLAEKCLQVRYTFCSNMFLCKVTRCSQCNKPACVHIAIIKHLCKEAENQFDHKPFEAQ